MLPSVDDLPAIELFRPHPRTNPSPVVLRLEKAPEHDTLSSRERAVASRRGEDGPRRRFHQPSRVGLGVASFPHPPGATKGPVATMRGHE